MVWSIYICGMHRCSWYGPSTFVECTDALGMVHLHWLHRCSWYGPSTFVECTDALGMVHLHLRNARMLMVWSVYICIMHLHHKHAAGKMWNCYKIVAHLIPSIWYYFVVNWILYSFLYNPFRIPVFFLLLNRENTENQELELVQKTSDSREAWKYV
jgi:hypothetical protein